MNFPLFIARRIYGKGAGSQKVAKPAIRIATAGVAIGLAVMIVTVSVILGFKHTIRDKVVGFGSHITVANIASLMSSDQYPIQMDDSMTTVLRAIPGVRHVERYAMTQGILKTDAETLYETVDGETRTLCRSAASGEKAYWGTSHEILIRDFYKAAEENKPFWIDGESAIPVLRLLKAVYASSAQDGKEIRL